MSKKKIAIISLCIIVGIPLFFFAQSKALGWYRFAYQDGKQITILAIPTCLRFAKEGLVATSCTIGIQSLDGTRFSIHYLNPELSQAYPFPFHDQGLYKIRGVFTRQNSGYSTVGEIGVLELKRLF